MGQAKLKKMRREVTDVERAKAQLAFAQTAARPEVVAVHEAALADGQLQARWKGDYPGQRDRLRRGGWLQVSEGTDGAGWWAHPGRGMKMIHSVGRETDGHLWGHFSMSRRGNVLPGWETLRDMQWLMYPGLAGVQVVAPAASHVNIGEVAHIWTCLTADPIPDFGRFGTI
jgi:hypothetical protein